MGKLGNTEHTVVIDGKTIRFEGGKLAAQAGGAVVASIDDTTVLATTTASARPRDNVDFFPLTVEVEERMYAAGKIPGGFFKREGRPSENAILTARLIDRPMRPTFADGLRNEIQIIITVLQTAQVDPYDVLAINAASIATMLAGVPFDGPIAGVRYAMRSDGRWTAFPSFADLGEDVVFDMVVAGRVTAEGEVAILMVEGEATERTVELVALGAPEPTEEVIGQALESVKDVLRQLCDAQREFVDAIGARPPVSFPIFHDYTDDVYALVNEQAAERLRGIYGDGSLRKEDRNTAVDDIRTEVVAAITVDGPGELSESERGTQANAALRSLEKKVIRALVTETGVRVDGRGTRDLRALHAEVGVLSRTHGSSIFQRGETQVLNVLALGMVRAAQRLDTLDPEDTKRYMHHYNFPPFSVGETGRVGSPKRREIGHGALAERALLPVVPNEADWPYALRLVSEVVSSNGSTSMASVCASTLSLMDGGVPIHAPVAGIAMGLIKEGEVFTTLTDIQGVEDAFGDMDFKVAGTHKFVTALQLDTKLSGVPTDVLGEALLQAREARITILDVMTKAISEPRAEVAEHAPRVITLHIPMDKIGEVIGPKGKIIREITDETGAEIDIDDDGSQGVVRIYSMVREKAEAAVARINAIANPIVPKEGERYHGTVVKTSEFGAFVNLTPGIDGLLHISKIGQKLGRRLDHAEEAINVGDAIHVVVKEVRDGRKFSLDYVREDGEEEPEDQPRERRPRSDSDRGDRGRGGERGRGGDRGGDRGGRDRGGDRSERSARPERTERSEPSERTEQPAPSQPAAEPDSDRVRTRTRTRPNGE